MSNPFAVLQDFGDQDNQLVIKTTQEKSKKTRPQKNQKRQPPKRTTASINEDLPIHPKSNVMATRDKRQPPPTKGISQGHTHDRRSGTGRVDKVRKEGGGWGGVGNSKDIQNKEKYIKEGQQQVTTEQKEQKPEQPANMTLQQYYQSKGININQIPQTTKEVVKKTQLDAEWIKKQKLTVMETKQDLKKKERSGPQTNKKQIMAEQNTQSNSQLLGFTSKASKKRPERQEEGQQMKEKNFKKKDNKKEKVAFNQDDFPAL